MPSLFGEPGRPMGMPYILKSITTACISREFATWALNRTSPIITVPLISTVSSRHLPVIGVISLAQIG